MALYRVLEGKSLGRHGVVYQAGDIVDLEPEVAADSAVAHTVEAYTPPPVATEEPPVKRDQTVTKKTDDRKPAPTAPTTKSQE